MISHLKCPVELELGWTATEKSEIRRMTGVTIRSEITPVIYKCVCICHFFFTVNAFNVLLSRTALC